MYCNVDHCLLRGVNVGLLCFFAFLRAAYVRALKPVKLIVCSAAYVRASKPVKLTVRSVQRGLERTFAPSSYYLRLLAEAF